MENKRYRVVSPLSGVHSTRSFIDRIYTEVPAGKPDHPACYEGEWVCDRALCPVRAVRVRVKAFFHQHLPRLRCPLCLRQMNFRHWLSAIALQEVPSEPPAEKACRAPSTKRGAIRSRKRKASPEAEAS